MYWLQSRRMYSVESPRFNAAIQSEVSAKLSESNDETEEEKEKEREHRRRMDSVKDLV
jgi:hypothetical protein